MPISFDRSLALFKTAANRIPSCTQTFSKGWTQFPFGAAPLFLEKSDGCFTWDVDGNRYVDWCMALGPVILGHNYPPVNLAVKEQIDRGVAFSLPHAKETELAEKLCRLIPCAEMVRFGKNGSDATSGAVRAARAFTGRDRIACCGYHGWQDWYIGSTSRHAGVPKAVRALTHPFAYNDIDSLKALFERYPDTIAGVILEPVGLIPPEDNFLEKVNTVAHVHGAVVIYDECWTGFRWTIGGAQSYFGVTPDLACFGKALGNGFPISVVAGRRDIMEIFNDIFFSFTFGGDMVGIAAALAVLDVLESSPVIPRIWDLGERLITGIKELISTHGLGDRLGIIGYPPKSFMMFSDTAGHDDLLLKSVVVQEMLKRGSLYAGYHVLSYSHSMNEIDHLLSGYDDILSLIARNPGTDALSSLLEGERVTPVFHEPPDKS